MKARYVQRGDAVDFIPSVDLEAGEIVRLGNLIGVTKISVKAGTRGTLALAGIFDVLKPAGMTFTAGSSVYWDSSLGAANKNGVLIGIAVQYAAAKSEIVQVLLNYSTQNQNGSSSGVEAEWLPL